MIKKAVLIAIIVTMLCIRPVHACDSECLIDTETETLLAQLVHAEAGNQSLLGKRYVVDVVLNRVESSRFKESTIKDVIYAPNQFTPARNGSLTKMVPTEEDYEAVRLEIKERTNYDILFFTAHTYVKGTTPVLIEGDHWFSK